MILNKEERKVLKKCCVTFFQSRLDRCRVNIKWKKKRVRKECRKCSNCLRNRCYNCTNCLLRNHKKCLNKICTLYNRVFPFYETISEIIDSPETDTEEFHLSAVGNETNEFELSESLFECDALTDEEKEEDSLATNGTDYVLKIPDAEKDTVEKTDTIKKNL